MNLNTINDIASELFLALKNQETVQPLSDQYDEIDINDAYQISRKFLSLREDQGEKVIGKKNRCYKPSCSRNAWGQPTRLWFFNRQYAS